MKKVFAILLACAMLLSIAACSTPQNDPVEDKELVVGTTRTFDNLNPFTSQQEAYVNLIHNNIMETLVYLDSNMEYKGALATEWSVSTDGLTYTFKLRDNAEYTSGEAFSSADVKYTIEYAKNPANAAWQASYFANITSIECPDTTTVVFHMSAVSPTFMSGLVNMPIVSAKQDPATYSTQLIGTGPFRFESFSTSDKLTCVKNDKYYDAANVNFEKLVIKFFSDEATAIASLKSKDVDVIYKLSAANAEEVKAAGLQVSAGKTNTTVYLFEIGLHNCEPFQENGVLEAMMMCLDTKTIADSVFYGYAKPSLSPVYAGTQFYKEVYGDTTQYNVQAAKDLLAKTSYADGFEFTINTMSGTLEDICVIWQQSLKQIGINMKIDVMDDSRWLESYLNRSYDVICNFYSMVGRDPATFATQIVAPLGQYQANEKYCPGLQELIAKAEVCTDEAERSVLYQQIQEDLAEYMPLYAYLNVENLYATAGITGIEMNGSSCMYFKGATR